MILRASPNQWWDSPRQPHLCYFHIVNHALHMRRPAQFTVSGAAGGAIADPTCRPSTHATPRSERRPKPMQLLWMVATGASGSTIPRTPRTAAGPGSNPLWCETGS